jgi:hypothetical protein
MNQISSCQLVFYYMANPFFWLASLANGVLNKGPKVWLAGVRPHPIKFNYVFSKVITYVNR